MESVKINSLEIENVKRVRAVKIVPTQNGLTVLGGRNNQGKTSILDSIAWVLGGNRFRPSNPQREGSVIPPTLKVTLNNGIVVERKGKNNDLKVTDPSGQKAGQQLLDSFVEQLALDLPKFMASSGKEKAQTFDNFPLPDVGRYEVDENGGGAFYPGDEDVSYASVGVIVNAWMPLPQPWKGE